MKKLYIFDIDQTIKPYFKSIDKKLIQKIQTLSQDHYVCLASGRNYEEIKPIQDLLKVDYVISGGGSELYYQHERLFYHPLEITDELHQLKQLSPHYIVITNHGAYTTHYWMASRHIGKLYRFFDPKGSVYWFLYFLNSLQCVDEIDEKHEVRKLMVFKKNYHSSLDYKHIGSVIHQYEFKDKAQGVRVLLDHLNEEVEIYAFGDGKNDISMFEMAHHTFAMKHGHPDLKKMADVIVPSSKHIKDYL